MVWEGLRGGSEGGGRIEEGVEGEGRAKGRRKRSALRCSSQNRPPHSNEYRAPCEELFARCRRRRELPKEWSSK